MMINQTKKLFFSLVVMALAGVFTQVSAQSILDFKIINNTGGTLYGVYVTDANTTNWGEDILPQDIVENDAVVSVSFPDAGDKTCEWDMKLTEDESEETSVVVYGLDLCDVSEVTLWIGDDGKYKYSLK